MNPLRTAAYVGAIAACAAILEPAVHAQRGQGRGAGAVRTRIPQADTMYGMPSVADLAAVDADVVFLGVPSELGRNVANGPGSSLGPGAIRAASMIGGPGRQGDGIYDRDTGQTMLKGARLVDGGNVLVPAGLIDQTLQNVTDSSSEIVHAGPAAVAARIPAADAYYVTIDIDVLDPSVAPATGTPVPGGLSYYQLCDVLEAIAAKGTVVGFDIMEVSPPNDFQNRSSQVAAFVIARFLGSVFQNRK